MVAILLTFCTVLCQETTNQCHGHRADGESPRVVNTQEYPECRDHRKGNLNILGKNVKYAYPKHNSMEKQCCILWAV